jgi:hypothetical protein
MKGYKINPLPNWPLALVAEDNQYANDWRAARNWDFQIPISDSITSPYYAEEAGPDILKIFEGKGIPRKISEFERTMEKAGNGICQSDIQFIFQGGRNKGKGGGSHGFIFRHRLQQRGFVHEGLYSFADSLQCG